MSHNAYNPTYQIYYLPNTNPIFSLNKPPIYNPINNYYYNIPVNINNNIPLNNINNNIPKNNNNNNYINNEKLLRQKDIYQNNINQQNENNVHITNTNSASQKITQKDTAILSALHKKEYKPEQITHNQLISVKKLNIFYHF